MTMKAKFSTLASWLVILSLLSSGCSVLQSLGGKTVTVGIVYGSEKQDWLVPLIQQFNSEKHKTDKGSVIQVEGTALGSIDAINQMLADQIKPVVWSPASSLYIPLAQAEWSKKFGKDLTTGTPKDLVLSPVVIAMWQPMAEALGWPQKALGWADIAALATSDKGWEAYGYPEWGAFAFGHTHPGYSNSGLTAALAEVYAGAGKQRGLTEADLQDEKLKTFVGAVESSIIHYGTSTGFFGDRMFQRGPSYLSAAVLYENLVAAQEAKRLAGQSQQLPVVAIYPKEGTFIANHPYIVLNAPWVTAEQAAAAETFQAYLLDKPQQLKALELGFRPSDVSIPFAAPLDAQHGVDTSQPKTTLEVPPAQVIQGVEDLWREVKKPVDVTVVMDISGSMEGDKINSARQSLIQFINLLDDSDRLELITFNDKIRTLVPLSSVGEKRADTVRHVSGIIEGGGTALYDAVAQAYQDLQANGDPKHIRGLVVLTDGQDTASTENTLDQLVATIGQNSEGGASIKVFTIAFGSDADKNVLKQIAEPTGGQEYDSDPKSINAIYAEIATFF
jgi:Ca-activated chloride channel family protein